MAEFLIYDKAHWMDALTDQEVADREIASPGFMNKYNSRYQRGDIVESRPDGYWTGVFRKGFNKNAFALLIIPDKDLSISKEELMTPLEEVTNPNTENEIRVMKKRRKYDINIDSLTINADKKIEYVSVGDVIFSEKVITAGKYIN